MPIAFGQNSPFKVYTFHVPNKQMQAFKRCIESLRDYNNYEGDEDYLTRASNNKTGHLFAFVADKHLEQDMLKLSRREGVISSVSNVKSQQIIDKRFLQKAMDFVDTGYSEWLKKHTKKPIPAWIHTEGGISPTPN